MSLAAVIPGPEHHGAVRHALQVVALLRAAGVTVTSSRELTHGPGTVWVPFTDALFGPDVTSAADAFLAWAAGVDGRLVVTLHDVPGSDPDPARDARRVTAYRRVAARADSLAVCSWHEAVRVREQLGRPVTTVPLPVEPPGAAGPRPAWSERPTVGVLGFVYPGKGHDRALEAARDTGATVVALGAASPGTDLAELCEHAHRLGVDLLVTGALTEPDLHAAALAVTVPLAAYATRGASASLHTWLAYGRRPVATPGPYAVELAQRWPGTVELRTDLATAVADSLADASRTWLAGPPPRPDVGGQYARLLAPTTRRDG